jgi:flagellar biogenesis protein FliO
MRRLPSRNRFFLGFFLGLVLAAPGAGAGEGDAVKPGETVKELLDSKEKGSAPAAAFPGTGTLLLKLVLSAGAVGLLGLGLIFVSRKCLRSGMGLSSSGEIEVTGRAALSPKHVVFVLRVDERRIVVGLSGERMYSLAVIGDRGEQGHHASRPEREISSSGKAIGEADLMPYRRQMDRLRGLFRGHFQDEGGSKES